MQLILSLIQIKLDQQQRKKLNYVNKYKKNGIKKVEGTCSLRMLMGNDAEVSNAYGIFRNRHSFSTWLRGEQAGNSGNLKAIQLQTGCRKYRNLRRYRRCGFHYCS